MKSPKRLRVLIVEDEMLIRWALTEALSDQGHSIVAAGTAAAAYDAIRGAATPMDVVLLDLRLPDSGPEDLNVLAAIRRQSPTSAVVIMTAHGTAETVADARAMGAYDVMSKPFDVTQVEDVLVKAHEARVH